MNAEFININPAKIILLELHESVAELQEMMSLSPKENEEFASLTSEKRKKEYLGVRWAISRITDEKTKLFYDPEGKPYLENTTKKISISHSGNRIAVIVHPDYQPGIDIEKINPKVDKVKHKFLTEKEQNNPLNVCDITWLTVVWSAKEALYKIIGKAAVDFSATIETEPFTTGTSGSFKATFLPTGKKYRLFYTINDYVLVYCIDDNKE